MKQKFTLKPLAGALMLGSIYAAQAQIEAIQQHQPTDVQINQSINSNDLILAVGIFDPKHQQLQFQNSGISSSPSRDYGIVQFHAGHSDFKWLQANGFDVIQSFSNHAYLVNWRGIDPSKLQQNEQIRWSGPFLSSYKVSPNLWQNNRAALTSYDLSVQVFSDYPVTKIKPLIRKFVPEAKFIQSNIPGNSSRIAIQVPALNLNETLSQLAATEAVQWINLYYPERFFNNEAVAAVQATSGNTADTPIFDQGLFGSGQIVGVADSGLDHNEDWFAHHDNGSGVVTAITAAEATLPPLIGTLSPDNKVVGYWVMPGAAAYDHGTNHGTHVVGSVAGDESTNVSSPTSSGYDNDDGMAPNAQILFQDIGSASGLTGVGSTPMWQQAYAAGVRIHSNSYGSSTFGEYVSSDRNVDIALRELDNMIIAIAAGNDDGFNNTTGSPANSKSALSVGALGHGNSTSVAGFSNRGLTDDGRLKPDIAATGSSIQSAAGDTNNSSTIDPNPSRTTKSGTSMSTPITAGTTALLRQYFTDGFYPTGVANPSDALIPSGPLMKAMLLSGTSTDSGFFDKNTGWGRPWLENTLYFPGSDRSFRFWDVTHESGLSTGESISFDVDVLAGEEFRAALVWYDVPGPTGSGVTLVNNLNLTVAAPGNTYLGNRFSGDVSITGGSADNLNTVEQVRLETPATGTYTITVDAPNVPGDGDFGTDKQGFALVVSGRLGSNSPVAIGDPSSLTANDTGVSGVDLNWSAASGADHYDIYRADGSCASMNPGEFRYIGQSTVNSYNDINTSGGYEYAYQIRAFNADNQSNYSNCADVLSTQACLIPPTYNRSSAGVSSQTNDTCEITLSWDAASSNCPTDPDLTYNIYRSDTHNFIPGPGNLLTTTAPNVTSFSDTMVSQGENYFYRISAVNNGNETQLTPELVNSPIGTPSALEGTMGDNQGVDDANLMMTLESPWSVSNDDSSAGSLSYRSAPEGANSYSSNLCARAYSPVISIPVAGSSAPVLSYKANYEIEADWDGIVVEISTDGGANWVDLPPVGGYPGDFSQTGNPAINGCGYAASHGAINGTSNGAFEDFSHALSAYTGQTVQFRWSFSTDPGFEQEGFYLDEINYENIHLPNTCNMGSSDIIFIDGFE